MGKITTTRGLPVLGQLLSLIDRKEFSNLVLKHGSDNYVKRFFSWDQMVSMVFAVLVRAGGLRELSSGLAGYSNYLIHLGVKHLPKRSTIGDANKTRPVGLYEDLFESLYRRYAHVLSDSSLPRNEKWLSRLFLVDSTTITLFKEILKACGRTPINGRRKGGLKVHVGMWLTQQVGSLICITSAATNDKSFMAKFKDMNKGTILVFDRAYINYNLYRHWNKTGVGFITRRSKKIVVTVLTDRHLSRESEKHGVIKDQYVALGHAKEQLPVQARMVTYYDKKNDRQFEFITNIRRLGACKVAQAYKQRWQIELLFKRLKQNLKFTSFLGDNENAIRIQIWCALIADLLMAVKRKGMKLKKGLAYSNMTGLIRLHIMRYVDLQDLFNRPSDPSLFSLQTNIQYDLFNSGDP